MNYPEKINWYGFAMGILIFFSFSLYGPSLPSGSTQDLTIQTDSLPPGTQNFIVDTIYTFDPATGKETVRIVKNRLEKTKKQPIANSSDWDIDTIIIFDPVTKTEEIKIIKNKKN